MRDLTPLSVDYPVKLLSLLQYYFSVKTSSNFVNFISIFGGVKAPRGAMPSACLLALPSRCGKTAMAMWASHGPHPVSKSWRRATRRGPTNSNPKLLSDFQRQ